MIGIMVGGNPADVLGNNRRSVDPVRANRLVHRAILSGPR
jgi:hypothetical protein